MADLPGRIWAARHQEPPGHGLLNGFCSVIKMRDNDAPYVREDLARAVVEAAEDMCERGILPDESLDNAIAAYRKATKGESR